MSEIVGDQIKDVNVPTFSIRYLCGSCPVQGEGMIGGRPWYFRARGNAWSLSIAPIGGDPTRGKDQTLFEYGEGYAGDGAYAAGHMSEAEALGFITLAMGKFLAEGPTTWSVRMMDKGHGTDAYFGYVTSSQGETVSVRLNAQGDWLQRVGNTTFWKTASDPVMDAIRSYFKEIEKITS